MRDEPRRSGLTRDRLRRAAAFLSGHGRSGIGILILALLAAALNAIEPLLLMTIIDALAERGAARVVIFGAAGLLAVAAVREAAGAASNWISWRVRLDVQHRLLEATVGRLNSLPIAFHRAETVGGTLTRLDRGIAGFVGALGEVVSGVLPALTYLVISLFIMLRLDWRLSIVVLAFTPLPALIGVWAAGRQTERERRLLDSWAALYSRFNEVLAGILTVKSYTMEEEEKRRFLRGVRQANDEVGRGVGFDSTVGVARNMVANLARIAAIGAGGWLVLRGELTIGALVAFLGYVGGLFGPVQGLTNVYGTLRRAAVSLDTIFGILDAPDELSDAPGARPVPPLTGRIEFDGVRFAYSPDRRILNGIDLAIEPGESVALVGPSGGGKSTLMALLQRLYDPDSGAIRVDGVDLRALQQRGLRAQIGVVLQEALLFNDTVRANIAYGRPGASDAEIEEAARQANAHGFIMSLPDGYDTIVGERGGRLSVGERQRVSIARALLKDPPILVLDEATSALDAESEALVQDALSTLMRGRTTLMIAHRLSTVVRADRIVVLRDGRLVEQGSHAELLAEGGYYAHLVERQTQGLLAA